MCQLILFLHIPPQNALKRKDSSFAETQKQPQEKPVHISGPVDVEIENRQKMG